MKKILKLIILIFSLFFIFEKNVFATTIRETLISGDGYDTIIPNTFVIGISKFTKEQVITAQKASIAGSNDAMLYFRQNYTTEGYEAPDIYYYLGADVGWFLIDSNNDVHPITDKEELSKLSSMDIYYVNNIPKKIEVPYSGESINTDSLGDGIEFTGGNLLVDATKLEFEIETTSGKRIKFIKDKETSNYIEDISQCFTVENGIITNYDEACGSNVTIPGEINGETITGIAENAFKGKNLQGVTFPSSIVSIGDNAFTDNENLTDVTFNGKYDTQDFESDITNAFDNNTEINYNNDLTRALSVLEDEYTIKIDSEIDPDTTNLAYVIYNEVFKEINKGNYSYHIEKSELTKYYMIHYFYDNTLNTNECVDHKENSFDIFFTIEEDGKYNIYYQKNANNCTRVMTVHKELKINYEKITNQSNKNIVNNVVTTLEENTTSNNNVVTRRSILEDLVDGSQLDYLFESTSAKIVDPAEDEEIGGSITKGVLYLFKDDTLYSIIDNFELRNLSNAYYPKISPKDYENMDQYIDAILTAFSEKTGVNDYSFLFLKKDERYIEKTSGANKIYYIGIFDNITLEYWSIFHKEKLEDLYDSNGFTRSSCFEVNEGILTHYNGNCGANVKIPNRINNQDITEISDSVFYNYGISSVTLPNHLTRIGGYAFTGNELERIEFPTTLDSIGYASFQNNKLQKVTIPSGVTIIENEAFRKNKITRLTLPNSLQEICYGAFQDNQLEDENAFIYARKYNEETNKYEEDNTKLVSYGGRNRDNITIPSNIKIIGVNAFQDLSLTNITIPNTVEEIESYAFANNNITSLEIPSSIKVINSLAFYDNNNLKTLILHEGLEEIWDYAFYGSNLKEISIPSTVKTIKEYALGYKITKLKVYGKESISDFTEIHSLYEDKIEFIN